MKKVTSLLIVLMLIVGIFLTGCGDNNISNHNVKDKQLTVENIKVGFIYVGPVGDGGWTFSHDEGRKYLEKELGNKPSVIKESVKENDAEVQNTVESMIDQGCNVIVGTSFGFLNGMLKSAKEHPEVKFMHCSGNKIADNLSNYFGRIYEARYLSGIVAGMKTKSNVIGYVAAHEMPEVVRGINAFTLGVRSVNPKAVVKVKWTNTWYDPAKEKEAGKALIDEGADVITQHQNTAGPQQAAEEKGAFSIGYNTDMENKAPKAYMTAPIWNWGPYYVKQIKAIVDGTWKSQIYWGGLKDGVVDISSLTKNAPEGAKQKINKAKEDIISGKKKIFAGPIKDNKGTEKIKLGNVMSDKELLKFNWFVEGVQNAAK
ncbi:BMP family ABC transporter substrate-binding protein [Clostridium botulinum]|uniref:Membrane protein n=1 Tax=Clostridium botulinum C/D str. DC5 TaxID=1443128 RepID=A0A0A0IK24_CLOBO|nr:BMP family ABC transporter substrate-binding protein [Clostridium botulinum]KEI01717.1 membrane protein [Clostridium botulinum C/D str. BKT75002]KEI07467.1 membrane protein [Clostridium botulinum C/D str. BKT2873]KGM93242.1 membrane protein [Clostridium botulinum D str. CCUG 7971]KGM99910.1 membrane protein [Clostridium botulinum C/D str. DC5]KOC49385.1 hypothetical protein ADU88_06055 [Clostridium botulinum]